MMPIIRLITVGGIIAITPHIWAQQPTATQTGLYEGKISVTSFHHGTGKQKNETQNFAVEIAPNGNLSIKDGPFGKNSNFTITNTYYGYSNGAAMYDSSGVFIASQIYFKTRGKLFGNFSYTIKNLNDRTYIGTFKLQKKL